MAKKAKRPPAGHTRKRSATAATRGRRSRTLKQPPLTGMEQVRHTKLDRLCESVGDTRDKKNQLQADEDGDIQTALDYMVKHNVESYHHHGLEFVLRPGAYKLTVRKHREMTATMIEGVGDGDGENE